MLAFTTKLDPRNLLIDLAFLGLSTITSAGPLPLADGPCPSADLRRAVAFFGAAAFGALGFRAGASGPASPPEPSRGFDLLATMRSCLSCCRLWICDERRRPVPAG